MGALNGAASRQLGAQFGVTVELMGETLLMRGCQRLLAVDYGQRAGFEALSQSLYRFTKIGCSADEGIRPYSSGQLFIRLLLVVVAEQHNGNSSQLRVAAELHAEMKTIHDGHQNV